MLILFPSFWLIVFPANFIVDSLVLIISMYALKLEEKKQFYKKRILWVFGFGMLSDIIGALYMLGFMMLFENYNIEVDNPILTLPALVISAALIFVFNYYVTFRKDEKQLRYKLSWIFAVATAPYTFLIPLSWMY